METQVEPTGAKESRRLSGNMGVGEVAMSVLAFSSPLTTAAGFIPVLLMFSGHTAPGIYLLLTLMLLIFAVGFVKMGTQVKNPGGFYAFISTGLGKPAGLGGATTSLLGYLMIGFFGAPFFGATMHSFVKDSLGGPDIPWWVYGVAIVLLTSILAYNKIDLSAKVLTIIMALEILVVLIFNGFAFANGATMGTNMSFALPSFGDASIGIALLFAAGNFLGFEATVIYRDEVKDPDKTIPRATYVAVAGIGLFYALAAWAYIAVFGANNIQAEAEANMVNMFSDSVTALIGKTFADIATILLITSVLASILSIHNVGARYMFRLANDDVLPARLGRVHPKHRSPYIAAIVVGVVWITATVLFGLFGVPPESIYPVAAGSGAFALILLMTIASLAVLVYFIRQRKTNPQSIWKTIIAPAISVVCLGTITGLAIVNYPDLIEGSVAMATVFVVGTFAVAIAGTLYAFVLRAKKPKIYAQLGSTSPDQV